MPDEMTVVVEAVSDGDLRDRVVRVEQIITSPVHAIAREELHGRHLEHLLELPFELVDGQEHQRGQFLDLDRLVVVAVDVVDDGGELLVRAPSLARLSKIPRDAGDANGVIVPGHQRHLRRDVPVDAAVGF